MVISGSNDKHIRTWEINNSADIYKKVNDVDSNKKDIAAIKILSSN